MKVQLADIKEGGLDLSFELTRSELDATLNDPRGELSGAGQGLTLQVHIDKVDETLIVRGRLEAEIGYACVRCTADQAITLTLPLDAVLMPRPELDETFEDEDGVELVAEDMDVSFYEGLEIDLSDVVREAIFLEMPTYPSCGIEPREDCPQWQANMGGSAKEMARDDVDLRWEALRAIKARMANKADD